MYSSTAAVSRPEITAFLEQAQDAEKFYLAQKVLPIYTAPARAGRYPRLKIAGGELLKKESTRRGPSGTYNEVKRKFEWDTFDCKDRGLEERIDDVNAAEMASFFDMEVATAKLVRRAVLLDYEVRAAGVIMDPTVFNATASVVAYTEANIATIDFARDLQDALDRMEQQSQVPNTLIFSRKVFNRLQRSTKLQTFLYGTLGAGVGTRKITPMDIGDCFGIENVMIAAANYDSAQKGLATSLGPVWGNDYIALANIQGGEFENGGLGRTIVWDADSPGGLFVSETYRDEKRRGNMVRVRTNSTEKVLDETACQLITTQWA